jgi:hypothetical protein
VGCQWISRQWHHHEPTTGNQNGWCLPQIFFNILLPTAKAHYR